MGQRLVVTIERNKKSIAKLYYHWSGYTLDALYNTRDIVQCIYNHKDETDKEMLLRLIRFCENNGGGIDGGNGSDAWKYITAMFPNETFKSEGISRDNGLIALNEEYMLAMQRMSEGDVYINLDTDQVDFCVYCGYETLEEYIADRKSWDDDFDEKELDNIPVFDFCLGCFDVNEVIGMIAKLEAADFDNIIQCDGEICELI